MIDFNHLADAINRHENSTKFPYGCEHRVHGHLVGYSVEVARQKCIELCERAYKTWDGKGDFFAHLNKYYAADKQWHVDVEKIYDSRAKILPVVQKAITNHS